MAEEPTRVDRLMSLGAAADELGVHYETVRRWVRQGALPAVEVGPSRALRVRASDLEALRRDYDPDRR